MKWFMHTFSTTEARRMMTTQTPVLEQDFNPLLTPCTFSAGWFNLLRWFWWRINALAEVVYMFIGIITALVVVFMVIDDALPPLFYLRLLYEALAQ